MQLLLGSTSIQMFFYFLTSAKPSNFLVSKTYRFPLTQQQAVPLYSSHYWKTGNITSPAPSQAEMDSVRGRVLKRRCQSSPPWSWSCSRLTLDPRQVCISGPYPVSCLWNYWLGHLLKSLFKIVLRNNWIIPCVSCVYFSSRYFIEVR